MSHPIDLINVRFSKLLVLSRHGSDKRSESTWLCVCDCGNKKVIRKRHLIARSTTSCGCAHRFKKGYKNLSATTHGKSKEKIYAVWNSMKSRCKNKNDASYKNYGGRGIQMQDSWNDFNNFFNDVGHLWKDGLSIDRKDNEKGYFIDNIRFVTKKTQQRNTRTNSFLTFENETRCVSEWAEIKNIKVSALFARIRYGWSVEKALLTPPPPPPSLLAPHPFL